MLRCRNSCRLPSTIHRRPLHRLPTAPDDFLDIFVTFANHSIKCLMYNQIKTIFNSTLWQVALLLIVSCMVLVSVSFTIAGNLIMSLVFLFLAFLLLVGVLLWTAYVLSKGRELRPMPLRPRIIVENVVRVMVLYWFYLAGNLVLVIIGAVFVVWGFVKDFKKLF